MLYFGMVYLSNPRALQRKSLDSNFHKVGTAEVGVPQPQEPTIFKILLFNSILILIYLIHSLKYFQDSAVHLYFNLLLYNSSLMDSYLLTTNDDKA